ncbi:hypothetical protein PsorP6_018841 [Peronosclerospora sorghi]|nr:hypothetical protein PsorP6_018841 [Peronosclerospora sorghi]
MLLGSRRYPNTVVLYDIDADKVQQVLNLLTAPRMRLTVVSKTFEGTTECVEQWYHTPYSEAPIASSLLERWASPPRNMALELPRRNEFVCQDFRIVTPPSPVSGIPITSPLLLQEDETCRLWYKPDVDFRKPKLLLFFRLDSPALSTTPYHAVLTSLFVRYVKDTLTEMAYDAELAGMEYELGLHARALELFAGGYSEKLPILVSKVLDQMLAMTSATYPLDEAIFQRVKDRTKRMYENVYLEEPYQHAVHQCSQLLETSRWSVDDKLRAIEHVTSTDLAAHGHALFRQVFIEGFFYGNLALSAARPLMEQVVQSFGCGRAERGALPLLPSQRVHPRIVLLSEASEYRFQQRAWNQENVNSAICTLYQVGCDAQDETLATQARLELFAHVFKEPFFHQLRTQEQLGYLVFSGITRLEGVHYFRLLIQSNVASPRVLDARMERFLAHFRSVLTDMPRPTWAQHVRAVVQAQRERPKYEMDDAMRSWHEIARETFRFDRRERVAAIVATLQPRDLVQFFDACFAVRGLDRSKLSVWVYGASHPMVELTQDERTTSWTARSTTSTGLAAAMLVGRAAERPVEVIDEISTFRRAMPLFRATKSVSTRSQ